MELRQGPFVNLRLSGTVFLRTSNCLGAGYNPGHQFPANRTFSQMLYKQLSFGDRNLLIHKGGKLCAGRMPVSLAVSMFAHQGILLKVGRSVCWFEHSLISMAT